MTIRSMVLLEESSFLGIGGGVAICGCVIVAETFSMGVGFLGKLPLPFNSQYKSTSGYAFSTLVTKSKLGLFRPLKICEVEERCTPIFSENDEALSL